MRRPSQALHLARRFLGSFDRRPPRRSAVEWVENTLSSSEFELWSSMRVEDRRHSIAVAERYRDVRPGASVAEIAGVLLHDVGKVVSDLGTWSRVVATLSEPRGTRFREYHEHEALGALLAERAGSNVITVAMIRGDGPPEMMKALAIADDY
jgi:hypothetical protein